MATPRFEVGRVWSGAVSGSKGPEVWSEASDNEQADSATPSVRQALAKQHTEAGNPPNAPSPHLPGCLSLQHSRNVTGATRRALMSWTQTIAMPGKGKA